MRLFIRHDFSKLALGSFNHRNRSIVKSVSSHTQIATWYEDMLHEYNVNDFQFLGGTRLGFQEWYINATKSRDYSLTTLATKQQGLQSWTQWPPPSPWSHLQLRRAWPPPLPSFPWQSDHQSLEFLHRLLLPSLLLWSFLPVRTNYTFKLSFYPSPPDSQEHTASPRGKRPWMLQRCLRSQILWPTSGNQDYSF